MKWYAEVDRFECRDDGGASVTVVVRQELRQSGQPGGQGLVHGSPDFATLSGEPIEKLDSMRFRLGTSGTTLTRRRRRLG